MGAATRALNSPRSWRTAGGRYSAASMRWSRPSAIRHRDQWGRQQWSLLQRQRQRWGPPSPRPSGRPLGCPRCHRSSSRRARAGDAKKHSVSRRRRRPQRQHQPIPQRPPTGLTRLPLRQRSVWLRSLSRNSIQLWSQRGKYGSALHACTGQWVGALLNGISFSLCG